MKGTHKTKSGKTAKKGLYYNINKRKKAGTSRTKKKSTISSKAYANMKKGILKLCINFNDGFSFFLLEGKGVKICGCVTILMCV